MRKRKPNDLDAAEGFRVDDLAQRYSVGPNVIFEAIRNGQLKARKLGDKPRSPVVVTREDWTSYLDSKVIVPRRATSEAA